jgi:hypothetical protein
MAHFALLDENNIVTFVTVGRDEDNGKEAELSARTGQTYKQTSYNTRGGVYYTPGTSNPDPDQSKAFRKNYAGIGYTYDNVIDGFIPPKPYASWLLNTTTGLWDAPVPYPTDGKTYEWDENTQSWILVPEPLPVEVPPLVD